MENERIRCRKCRSVLLSKTKLCVLDAHGEEYHHTVEDETSDSECTCLSLREHSCLYLSEESFPDFVLQAIEESSWTKGKIYCPACEARLGSFNFVSGSQCACGSHVLPQVHILKSKVDWMKVNEPLPHPVSFPNQSVILCASALPLDESVQVSPLEVSGVKEGAALGVPRSFTDLPHPADISPQDSSSRSHKKMDAKSSSKVKHRKQNRKKITTDANALDEELSGGQTAKTSCFEVLDDELIGSEDGSSSEKDERDVPDNLVCPVCLDILYSPLVTKPCGHIFCEPCLRRMARPNPTNTHCPLCRQIIGQCMPCPELALNVRERFLDLYQKRRNFELQHNSQHLPLPWIRNFRLRNAYNTGGSWVEWAGGWRAVIAMMSLNILGVGIVLYLGKEVKTQSEHRMS
ncbi:hypothetical protein O3P69_020257 [Scylla paramamosain]|uniref:RING-type domain-containing protein n=1 Tax=Scylla paramamosain TaxID=85552 RepID=A0AAW0TL49_SCYPA